MVKSFVALIYLLDIVVFINANPISTTGFTTGSTIRSTTTGVVNRTANIKYAVDYYECEISNPEPLIKITWLRDNKEVSSKNYTKSDPSTYRLKLKGLPSEIGTYHCEMRDSTYIIYSQIVTLKPSLTVTLPRSKTQSTSVSTGDNVTRTFTVQCIVSSWPKANVTFLRDQAEVSLETKRMKIRTEQVGGIITHELTIEKVSYLDAAEYKCRATNGYEVKSTSADILSVYETCSEALEEKQWRCPDSNRCVPKSMCVTYHECIKYNCQRPTKPDAQVVHCTHDAVEIRWKKDDHAQTYHIEVMKSEGYTTPYETMGTGFMIDTLQNNTHYTFEIHAQNKFGKSDVTTVTCKTLRMVRPTKVQNAKLLNDEKGFSFDWKASLDDGMKNEPGSLKYKVKYCPHPKTSSNAQCKEIFTNKTSLDVNEVPTNSRYQFIVTPINKAGQTGDPQMVIEYTPTKKMNSSAHMYTGSGFLQIFCSIILTIFVLYQEETI